MNELDDLLSHPVPAVADDGFSAHVMRRVRVAQIRAHWPTAVALLVCIVLLLVVTPLDAIGALFGAAVPHIAGLWALNLAAGLVVVSLLAVRPLSRM